MKIILRLYRSHDLDLIYLAHNEDFSMCGVAKYCLEAFADGKACKIAFPKGKIESYIDKNSYSYIITLNDDKDQKIIKLIESIKYRQRNGFIKNLIRSYLEAPFTLAYLTDSDYVNTGNKAFEQLVSWECIVAPPKKKRRDKTSKNSEEAETKSLANKQGKQRTGKKKNAIEALGSALLTAREDDKGLLSKTESTGEKTADTKTGSVMFPAPDTQKLEPVIEAARKPDEGSDDNAGGGFDLDNALSSMMNEY